MVSIDLGGKTAIVTGSGQGLGAAIAIGLHKAGANVVVNYFNDPSGINQQRAREVAEHLGQRAMTFDADVREPGVIEEMLDATVQRFGALNFVINNAGILRDHSLRKMTDQEWQSVIDTNLTGVFNVCRAAQSRLTDDGRVVNLSSIAALTGFFGQCNYASAKAGVIALTKVLSKELANRRITVNAVAPGVVLTEMGKSIPEQARANILNNIPLNRFGEPEDIAHAIVFLCSDMASYITGQTIHVNGGWYG